PSPDPPARASPPPPPPPAPPAASDGQSSTASAAWSPHAQAMTTTGGSRSMDTTAGGAPRSSALSMAVSARSETPGTERNRLPSSADVHAADIAADNAALGVGRVVAGGQTAADPPTSAGKGAVTTGSADLNPGSGT